MSQRPYNPVRQANVSINDPLEVELAFNVSSCGTCSFFWPNDVSQQPYGPYPCFDFTSNMPTGNLPAAGSTDFKWLEGVTTGPGFPTGEIMDGCRKAPIMTIGINPNLTAFLPGQQGASWAYPNFTNNNGNNMWENYAYYYRYRSVYQEHLDFNIMNNYVVAESGIKAAKNGIIKAANRTNSSPSYTLTVQYDGDTVATVIQLNGVLGQPPFALLLNIGAKFNAGDMIAAQLDVPQGVNVDVYQGQIGYYEQFVPALTSFEQFLVSKGMADANLQMGEDVCQLDMVACASPHWTNDYLGNSPTSETTVINNCVSKNAWAVKQLVQTKPAVLYLVGEASYTMFTDAFKQFIKKNTPLPQVPEDGAFTLFRQTLDPADPCMFEFSTTINGQQYSIATRLIVTPHFSYGQNFLPQFRMSQQVWADFKNQYEDCYAYLFNNPDTQYMKPQVENGFIAITLTNKPADVLSELSTTYADAYEVLKPLYFDPHNDMAGVLIDLFNAGKLTYTNPQGSNRGYLSRTDGSCQFCANNNHWTFQQGCPYNKTTEPAPPVGFLRAVAAQMVANGQPAHAVAGPRFESLFVDR